MTLQSSLFVFMSVATQFTNSSAAMAQGASRGDQSGAGTSQVVELERGPDGVRTPDPDSAARGVGAEDAESLVADDAEESRFHLSLGADFTTAYFFRGFRYEDSGLIAQPYVDASFDLFSSEDATISLAFGNWNSFQSEATDAMTSDGFGKYWYETDLYAGLGLTLGNWELEALYYFYISPSDAFETVQEVYMSAAYDDSELMGAWSLKPSAVLAVETGAHANDGGRNGIYLELGISPGFSIEDGAMEGIEIAFPVSVGLSLSDYYEGENGENDTYGYTSVGATLMLPLGSDASSSSWTLTVGVQGLFLGDVTSESNNDNHYKVIGTVGISVEF